MRGTSQHRTKASGSGGFTITSVEGVGVGGVMLTAMDVPYRTNSKEFIISLSIITLLQLNTHSSSHSIFACHSQLALLHHSFLIHLTPHLSFSFALPKNTLSICQEPLCGTPFLQCSSDSWLLTLIHQISTDFRGEKKSLHIFCMHFFGNPIIIYLHFYFFPLFKCAQFLFAPFKSLWLYQSCISQKATEEKSPSYSSNVSPRGYLLGQIENAFACIEHFAWERN